MQLLSIAFFYSFQSLTAYAAPDTTFHCSSDDSSWTLSVDAYLTGHPQGGLASVEGIMSVNGAGRSDKLRVSFSPNYNQLTISGSSSSPSAPRDYELKTLGDVLSAFKKIESQFIFRKSAKPPFQSASEWKSMKLICSRTN